MLIITNTVSGQTIIKEENDNSIYFVSKPCAVFFEPDSIEFAKMEKEMDTISLADVVEDNQAYSIDAYKLLNTSKCKAFFTDARIIKFSKKDGTIYFIDKSKLENLWGLYLFDGINDPKLSSLTDMVPSVKEFLKTYKN